MPCKIEGDWKQGFRWYCCYCGDGPMSLAINASCSECTHDLCWSDSTACSFPIKCFSSPGTEQTLQTRYTTINLVPERSTIPSCELISPKESVDPLNLSAESKRSGNFAICLPSLKSPGSNRLGNPELDNDDQLRTDDSFDSTIFADDTQVQETKAHTENQKEVPLERLIKNGVRQALDYAIRRRVTGLSANDGLLEIINLSGEDTAPSTNTYDSKPESTGNRRFGHDNQQGQREKSADDELDRGDERKQATTEQKAPNIHEESSNRVACPFFKRNPFRYRDCGQRKLEDVSRVKDHLKRVHYLHECGKCFAIFPEKADMDEHKNKRPPCLRRDESERYPIEAVNESMVTKWRSKSGRSSVGLREQWNELYSIVFKQDAVIPSCYHEDQDEVRKNEPYLRDITRMELDNETEMLLPQSVLEERVLEYIRNVVASELEFLGRRQHMPGINVYKASQSSRKKAPSLSRKRKFVDAKQHHIDICNSAATDQTPLMDPGQMNGFDNLSAISNAQEFALDGPGLPCMMNGLESFDNALPPSLKPSAKYTMPQDDYCSGENTCSRLQMMDSASQILTSGSTFQNGHQTDKPVVTEPKLSKHRKYMNDETQRAHIAALSSDNLDHESYLGVNNGPKQSDYPGLDPEFWASSLDGLTFDELWGVDNSGD